MHQNPNITSYSVGDCLSLKRRVLRTIPKKQRESGEFQYDPPDEWFRQMFENPPSFKDAKGVEQPGWARILNELPLYRARTRDEAAQAHAAGQRVDSPLVLVPWKDRFVINDDVTAPLFGLETYDTPLGSGVKYHLKGLIWLGEKQGLNMQAKPVEGVDPTTYFLIAQKYERTKENFNPRTVENTLQRQ
jgi:hypothetical protein